VIQARDRGVRDAFAPPGEHPHGHATTPVAKQPPTESVAKSPLLEDDADGWAAISGNETAKAAADGSLAIVDTGVVAVNQVTVEGHRWIQQSDRVLFLGADPVTEHWLSTLNENVESLDGLETKDEIIERMTDHVRAGMAVCLAHHGRPPLIAEVLREAIALGRAENWLSAIAPGVSVLDCLFSDLGLDPLRDGCQIFAAEHFLERRQRLNTSTALVVSLGDNAVFADVLALLRDEYGADHPAIVYEPARYAILEPVIRHNPIGRIDPRDLDGVSYLCIPPKVHNA
jgi:uncharacterized protein YabN with tetrapyrrole methylase and pyrophosphatase domain